MAMALQEELDWDFLAEFFGSETFTALSDRVELEGRCVPDPAKESEDSVMCAPQISDRLNGATEEELMGYQPSSGHNKNGQKKKRKMRALSSFVAVKEGKARSKRYECEHGRYKYQCKECHGSSRCQHNSHFGFCMQCDSRYLCRHGKSKYTCSRCKA